MTEPDIDRILRRRLTLQRYVSALVAADGSGGELIDALQPGDRRLITALGDFVADADERALAALARHRTSHPEVRAVLAVVRETMTEQSTAIHAVLDEQLPSLVETEARIAAEAIGARAPSVRGVLSEPVGGLTVAAVIAASLATYERRLLGDITTIAGEAPERIVRAVRGTRAERYRDGVIGWRNRLVLRPAADRIVKGAATNTAMHTYRSARVERIDWIATLDFRTCVACIAREANGPYPIDRAPRPPEHNECRCVPGPAQPDGTVERPYVRDIRPVKDIPKAERTSGKIGTTKLPIEAFFERMTKAQRRAVLGPSRATLWEQGKVTDLRGFVSAVTNDPLRLDQLPDL